MKAYIYGSGSFSALIRREASKQGYEIIAHLDDFNSGDSLLSYARIRDEILKNDTAVFLGVGYKDMAGRMSLLKRLIADGVRMPNLISDSADIDSDLTVGFANVFLSSVTVGPFCSIGNGNVFWHSVVLSHDNSIGDNNFFSPGVVSCGFVRVGNSTFIGANSTLVDSTRVSDASFIKAGQVYSGGRS